MRTSHHSKLYHGKKVKNDAILELWMNLRITETGHWSDWYCRITFYQGYCTRLQISSWYASKFRKNNLFILLFHFQLAVFPMWTNLILGLSSCVHTFFTQWGTERIALHQQYAWIYDIWPRNLKVAHSFWKQLWVAVFEASRNGYTAFQHDSQGISPLAWQQYWILWGN